MSRYAAFIPGTLPTRAYFFSGYFGA